MGWLRSEALKFAVLLMVALGAGPVGAAMWQWSTTASSNATADPSINWSEGMSPSSVNDSARAMMAATASFRNDLAGLTATGGSSTAYTLSSNQGGFATATGNNFIIGFIAHATNGGGGITINVDGAGALPLRAESGVALPAGTIVANSVYQAVYQASGSQWLLHNIRGVAAEIPIGAIIDYSRAAVPSSNYIFPEGQCISRTTYATYFGLVGTFYGVCDGVTTFGVPDLRGRVVAHQDSGINRLNGCTALGCGTQSFVMAANQMPLHSHSVNIVTDTESANHTHAWVSPASRAGTYDPVGGGAGLWFGTSGENTSIESTAHTHNVNGNTGNTGGAAQISLVQPTSTMWKILRVL